MKKVLVVVLLFSVVVTSSSFADKASHKRTALEFLEVSNTKEVLDQMMTSIEDMMEQQFKTIKLTPEEEETAVAIQKETMDWFSGLFAWEQLRELYAEIYVKVFTEDELKELIQFYRSPLGQKLLKKMPELLQESIEMMQVFVQDKMPEFQERLKKITSELEEKYKSSDMTDTGDSK